MAGESIPALHTWNVGLEVYVKTPGNGGSDSNNGLSAGAAKATLQGIADALKNTITWPTNQDVRVNIGAGTYQGSGNPATVDIWFNTSGRGTNANRFVIWTPAAGSEGQVIIKSPASGSPQCGCIKVEEAGTTNDWNGRQIFWGLELDGEGTRKGAIGNGNSFGVYFAAENGNPNTQPDCEVVFCKLHGFQNSADGVAQASAQAIPTGAGITNLKIYYNRIYDVGTTTLTTDKQEHGVYVHRKTIVVGNAIYRIPNGHSSQFYDGGADVFDGCMVLGNTFYSAEGAGVIIHRGSDNTTIVNNIVSTCSSAVESYGSGTATSDTIDTNQTHSVSANTSGTFTGWTITNFTTQNPLFADAANGNFVPAAAVGAVSAYRPLFDPDGNARTSNVVGAFDPAGGGVTLSNAPRMLFGVG